MPIQILYTFHDITNARNQNNWRFDFHHPLYVEYRFPFFPTIQLRYPTFRMCVETEHVKLVKVFIEINLLCTKVICSQTCWMNLWRETWKKRSFHKQNCVEYWIAQNKWSRDSQYTRIEPKRVNLNHNRVKFKYTQIHIQINNEQFVSSHYHRIAVLPYVCMYVIFHVLKADYNESIS